MKLQISELTLELYHLKHNPKTIIYCDAEMSSE
jgi:hypothetical protein